MVGTYIRVKVPWTMHGPEERVVDHGAKALSAIASLIDSVEESEIAALALGVADPVGRPRHGLPASQLPRRVVRALHGRGPER